MTNTIHPYLQTFAFIILLVFVRRLRVFSNLGDSSSDGDSPRQSTRYEEVSPTAGLVPRQRTPHTVGVRHVRDHWLLPDGHLASGVILP